MLENQKEYVKNKLKPIARGMTGINPNTLTLLGLFISFVSAYYFANREVFMAGVFLLLSGFFDAIDGAVARENNMATNFGGFLDSVSDRFADSAIIIGAMYGGLTSIYSLPAWILGVLAIVGSFMVSYTRARAEAAGASVFVGVGDRSVRMIIIIFGAFVNMVNWAILLVAILSFITVFQRMIYVRNTLK
ncbi:MAG: CDP-alcohol phosphatidyltransferase family protein [Spirochaetes bacterium]|nr:CDP-alcohol phosphatidyltransferase family protein [Spirochaetota bacterium]